MIATETVNKVDSSFGTGQRLTIAATAAAMKVLSKNLYSDSVRAVLREIGTNAADSHIQSGIKDKPFEVHLPTYEKPTLKIRDFGDGIPPDKVVDIYCVYFSSTKTGTNELNGFLGLGSKSPLGIADQFTLEISYDGQMYYWLVYRDEEGYPCIPEGKPSLIQPTDEPSGVTVTIPISDARRFEETARDVYSYFETIPLVFKGKNRVDIKAPVKKSTFTSCWFEEGRNCFALMSNVLYPINSQISGLEGYEELGQHNKVIIPFKNGELSFSASRESLEFEKRTINALKAKLKQITSEFAVEVQQNVDKQAKAWDAILYFNSVSLPYTIKYSIRDSLTFKGQKLISYYHSFNETNYEDSIMLSTKTTTGISGLPVVNVVGVPLLRFSSARKKGESYWYANINKNVKFYYNDLKEKRGVSTRLLHLAEQTKETYYLLTDHVDVDKWLALNHLTKDDLHKVSEVAKVPSTSTYESRKKAGVFKPVGGRIQKDFWGAVAPDDVPDEAYYLTKVGDKILVDGKEHFPVDWMQYQRLGILPTDMEVYGISRSFLKNFEDWTKLDEPLAAAMELKREELELAYSNKESVLLRLIDYWPDGAFKTKLEGIRDNVNNIRVWQSLFDLFGKPLVYQKKLEISSDAVLKKYPMLKPLVDYYNRPSNKEVSDYITKIGDIV